MDFYSVGLFLFFVIRRTHCNISRVCMILFRELCQNAPTVAVTQTESVHNLFICLCTQLAIWYYGFAVTIDTGHFYAFGHQFLQNKNFEFSISFDHFPRLLLSSSTNNLTRHIYVQHILASLMKRVSDMFSSFIPSLNKLMRS